MKTWLPELEGARNARERSDSDKARTQASSLANCIATSSFEPGRGYRAHYNLACYWTRIRSFDNTLKELRLAFESGNVGDMAQTDEALAPLKQKEPAEWGKLFAPPARSLAAFTPMGSASAKTLYDAYGIDGAHEFVARSDTDAKRQDVAEKLIVSPEAVKEWHDLLDRKSGVEG